MTSPIEKKLEEYRLYNESDIDREFMIGLGVIVVMLCGALGLIGWFIYAMVRHI